MSCSRRRHRHSLLVLPTLAFLAAALGAPDARAQGCVAVRLDAPGVGALPGCQGQGFGHRWEVTTTYRYFESDRHFRGTHYEGHRTEERSQVINTVHQLELGVRYNVGPRWNLTLGIPYLMAERTGPLRNSLDEVVDRGNRGGGRGLGDVSLIARRWMIDPAKGGTGNVSLGLGIKLPTGDNAVQGTRERAEDVNEDGILSPDERWFETQTVDQSVQPGDGGFGFFLDVQAYQTWREGRTAFYASLTYLANPEGTDRVPTHRSNPHEQYMSIADQYVARMGVTFTGTSWHGIALGVGGRIEGVPVHDLFGSSKHFRRPGYSVSIEPSLSVTRGSHTFGLTIPIAVQRNRERSVPDKLTGGTRHGDAAFADWSLIASYSYRFGKTGPEVHDM